MLALLTWLGSALLDVLLPPRCALCGRLVADASDGRGVGGAAALCGGCARCLTPAPELRRRRDGAAEGLGLAGGRRTDADLAAVVGACKYRNLRSLARPLAGLAVAAVVAARQGWGDVDALVPIPLHRRRRRERGFNQAALIAALVAEATGLPVRDDLLRRRRATAQQARLDSDASLRRGNVAGAFVARTPARDEPLRLALVDDLITTGATAAAAAVALTAAGWRTPWAVAAGVAATSGALDGEP